MPLVTNAATAAIPPTRTVRRESRTAISSLMCGSVAGLALTSGPASS
jgi:hypothetical protein